MTRPGLPPLPYDEWRETRDSLHLFCQIVGKMRMGAHPKLNHWWHVTLYPDTRGLTTGRVPCGNGAFRIDLDLLDHVVRVTANDGRHTGFDIPGLSAAGFLERLRTEMKDLGFQVPIIAKPYEHPSTIPFEEDTAPRVYDTEAATRYWQALCSIASIFETWRGRFAGKQTPVHLFWHSFDLVVTRFSGRAAPMESENQVEREAYSHEVVSVGFWPGDAKVRKPAFYAYAYPEPAGLRDLALPHGEIIAQGGGSLALLDYETMRTAEDPAAVLLGFLDGFYEGAARLGGWEQAAMAPPHRVEAVSPA